MLLNFIFFLHLFFFLLFILYVYVYFMAINNEIFLYDVLKNDKVGWIDQVLRDYDSYRNEMLLDEHYVNFMFEEPEFVILNGGNVDFLEPLGDAYFMFMSSRYFMFVSEYSRVFSVRNIGLHIIDYFNYFPISPEEYDCNFLVGSYYKSNMSKYEIEFLDTLVLNEIFSYLNYLEDFFDETMDEVSFPRLFFFGESYIMDFLGDYFEIEDSFESLSLFFLFLDSIHTSINTICINYIYLNIKFNFLSFIFLLLTFVVFFVVWFYSFCVGITRLEIFIYAFIELLSYLIFMVDNLLFFIVILEITTIALLFTYNGDRYRRFRSMSLLFYYTLVSGLFLLFIFLVREVGFFYYISERDSLVVFIILMIGIFIKLPIYPFHLWLPEAHAEATTSGSLILAGVILKMGFYGFIYFVGPEILFFPYKNFVIGLLLFSSCFLLSAIYVQVDIKKIIAYSSVIHMQIAIATFLMDSLYAFEAALLIVINHGLVSVGLFVIASLYIQMEGTRDIIKWTYSSNYLSKIFLFFILSNMSFPFTMGFWGEFLSLYSVLNMSFLFIFLFILNQLIVIIYNLRLYWLVLSAVGPYYRIRGLAAYKVTIILIILVFFNFILFFSVLHYLT